MAPAPITLADVMAKAAADITLTAIQRRDMVSALKRIAKVFATALDTIEASPRRLRALFALKSAAQLGLSDKSFANIRSLAIQALSRYGTPDLPITRRFAMTPVWRELLDRIEKPYNRQTLHRLAIYCSRTGLSPEDVTPDTLIGFKAALEAEEIVKDPAEIVSNTISKWNGAVRDVPGWPQQKLCEPNKEIPLARPLSDFPASFQADVETWYQKMSDPDPLDEKAPVKPLRPATLAHRLYTFRSFASALVACGHYALAEITSLAALLQPDAFKAGIRFFHDRNGGKTQRIHNMARNLRLIGKNHCGLDEATVAQLEAICKRLDPGKRHQMTDRNRKRLAQFDDPANVAKLLHFPEREEAWAMLQTNLFRRAKGMERALAVSLLIFCGLRISPCGRSSSRTSASSTRAAAFSSCRRSARRAIARSSTTSIRRSRRSCAASSRITVRCCRARRVRACFRVRHGPARSQTSMSKAICEAIRDRAGLEMNVHLFRHAIAKIAVERDPGAYLSVSRVLGHTSLDTTMAHYLGTDSKAAGRHLDRLLTETRESGTAHQLGKQKGKRKQEGTA